MNEWTRTSASATYEWTSGNVRVNEWKRASERVETYERRRGNLPVHEWKRTSGRVDDVRALVRFHSSTRTFPLVHWYASTRPLVRFHSFTGTFPLVQK